MYSCISVCIPVSAPLRFRIFYAESINGNAFHHLIFVGAVGLALGGDFRNFVHYIHAFNNLSESRIASVQMRSLLVHNKEVWSWKAAYLLDILSLLEFVDNKLTTIFVLNSTEQY